MWCRFFVCVFDGVIDSDGEEGARGQGWDLSSAPVDVLSVAQGILDTALVLNVVLKVLMSAHVLSVD